MLVTIDKIEDVVDPEVTRMHGVVSERVLMSFEYFHELPSCWVGVVYSYEPLEPLTCVGRNESTPSSTFTVESP